MLGAAVRDDGKLADPPPPALPTPPTLPAFSRGLPPPPPPTLLRARTLAALPLTCLPDVPVPVSGPLPVPVPVPASALGPDIDDLAPAHGNPEKMGQ